MTSSLFRPSPEAAPYPLLLRDPALLDFDPLLLHSLLILDLSQLTGCELIATAMRIEREQLKRERSVVQKRSNNAG